ncbi:NAD-dependent epimerase/dehydratase family protein [Fodinicola acaciae]|uniref:NAD-dependent epimerase/dehydratase family protein n=1 Tax=Fodinicola acaciae TaxID=2681555 RepID=UPI0013D24B49|nr:NAD-dependent epimerase/dehydratase family protein [Fodinicola acaciae]
MRLLILGGTAFLSRQTARQAVARGHQVTCAARGSAPTADGVELVRVDRDSSLDALAGREFDAVIDVARRPSHVRRALDELSDRVGHWIFVSTVSVYADDLAIGRRVENSPLLAPLPADGDETLPGNYGHNKVSCENLVTRRWGSAALVVRAGLIVGPDDPSNRFPYWVSRIARGGEVLAPGDPADLVQCVDVRDLASWLVDGAEKRLGGTYDSDSPPMTRADFLDGVRKGVGADATFTWVPQEFLVDHQVEEWMGPRSLPLWVKLPENAGFMSRDVTAVVAAGHEFRDISDSAAATLAWLRAENPTLTPAGLTAEEEAKLLAAWRG